MANEQRHLERARAIALAGRSRRCAARRGFSLIELLIVIAVMGVIAAILIPNTSTSLASDLNSVAEVIVAELDFVRNLAVTYGSEYELKFSDDGSQLITTHIGSNPALDSLPAHAFAAVGDNPTERILRVDELTSLTGSVAILGLVADAASGDVSVDDLVYGPLGETTRSEVTIVWLSTGAGSASRYLPIEINPVTGIAGAGEITATYPSGLVSAISRPLNADSDD